MKRFTPLLVGIIFLAVGTFLYFKNSYLVKNCTEEVVATVVDIREEYDSGEDGIRYLYYPVIEYEVESNTVKKSLDSGSSTPAYSINDKITILYNPNKVEEFYIKGNMMSNIFSYVFMGLGVLVTCYGVKVAVKGS